MTKGETNTVQRIEVERIVREVLTQMQGAGRQVVLDSACRELVLMNKVISVSDVKDRLSGVTRVVAPRGAVFTPAARDELQRHNVAIASVVPRLG